MTRGLDRFGSNIRRTTPDTPLLQGQVHRRTLGEVSIEGICVD